MTRCPACLEFYGRDRLASLAAHFETRAGESDPDHIRWLNQNLSRRKLDRTELKSRLATFFDLGPVPLKVWLRKQFIAKFYGTRPHAFPVALQHPTRAVLLGYVVEHAHFLRQWVRSCACIIARTDRDDVIRYELDNLNTEFGSTDPAHPAHYDLLLRMGESLGLPRPVALGFSPLPSTQLGVEGWNRIATETHWVEAMAAMHGLELIANRNLVDDGATLRYFDPAILEGDEIPPEAQAFLREGYEADVGHSELALELVDRYAGELGIRDDVQATFLRSLDLFDDYLIARLERARDFEAAR
jgi:pyrroloquinoline-quinone synthase